MGGEALAKRNAATLSSVGSHLVLFGGDKSLAAACHAPGGSEEPWQWVTTSEADRATARKGHAAAVVPGTSQLVVCGGQALEGEATDLSDVRLLVGSNSSSSAGGINWQWQPAAAMQLHQRADGTEVPTERSSHCAVALGSMLLMFGGEHQGQLLQELCLLDLSNKVAKSTVVLCLLLSLSLLPCTINHSNVPKFKSILVFAITLPVGPAAVGGACGGWLPAVCS
jgi:hypothetical protein